MILLLLLASLAPSTEPSSVPVPWSRPRIMLKLNAEFPYGIGPGVEVTVHPWVTVGADLNISARDVIVRVSSHLWPLSAGRYAHQFLFGVGADFSVNPTWPTGGATFVAASSINLRYLGRPWPLFGFIAGTRLGIGGAFDTNDLAGRPSRPLDHLAFSGIMYVGVAFLR